MEKINNKISSLVINLARKKIDSRESFLIKLKNLAKKYQLAMPGNSEILASYKMLRAQQRIRPNKFFENQLKKRPVRSLSGVAVISVLTKPYPCPGNCLYCPVEKGFPKSYLAGEPAAERAKNLKYDPYRQVKYRIETLQKIGHSTDKIELIVIGASWTAYPEKYKHYFIKRCFKAANEVNAKFQNPNVKSLEQAQKQNEKAKNRIISISVETRPDLITLEEIKKMRELGITKVELGVQTLDDKILAKNKRGHGLKEIIETTKLLKNAGFKICYHVMPGLYGSNPKKDLAMFKKIFSDQNFRPDYLKIYPCVVVKGSQLYKLWKNKKYKPYSDKTLIDLLIKMKRVVPPYVRIIRIIRDIPSPRIEAGTKVSNLREVIQEKMKQQGLKCHCIRCREIKNLEYRIKNIELKKYEYIASDGKEIFLSFEDIKNDKILAFLRLRLPLNRSNIVENTKIDKDNIYKHFPILKNSAIIRELHTYGELVQIGKKKKGASQHKNLGKKLVKEAEKIVKKEFGWRCSDRRSPALRRRERAVRIVVIAGIGSREYWRKLGYKLEKTYMVKEF